MLAKTTGLDVAGQATKVGRVDPATFIGSGKVEEVEALSAE